MDCGIFVDHTGVDAPTPSVLSLKIRRRTSAPRIARLRNSQNCGVSVWTLACSSWCSVALADSAFCHSRFRLVHSRYRCFRILSGRRHDAAVTWHLGCTSALL